MTGLTVTEFADRVSNDMAAISKEFVRQQAGEFYKVKATLPQLAILELLYRKDELKMSDMARSMNVTTPAMTGIVDKLVRDGYCVRSYDPDDRRVIKIKLTTKGNAAVKSSIENKKHMISKVFGVLPQKERDEYLKILKRIREGLNK